MKGNHPCEGAKIQVMEVSSVSMVITPIQPIIDRVCIVESALVLSASNNLSNFYRFVFIVLEPYCR